MADWPIGNSIQTSETSGLLDVPKGTSVNTKGIYLEMIASTLHAAVGFYVTTWGGNPPTRYLVDIAIGAAASEQVIVENLVIYSDNYDGNHPYFIPLSIPAGSRVSARCQNASTSGGIGVGLSITVMYGSHLDSVFSRCVTYGADTSDSGGTPMVSGTYVELTSGLTHDIKYLIMAITGRNVVLTAVDIQHKIAIGAAASEQDLIGGLISRADSSEEIFFSPIFSFPVSIPAGTRVSVQADDSQPDIVLYGFS